MIKIYYMGSKIKLIKTFADVLLKIYKVNGNKVTDINFFMDELNKMIQSDVSNFTNISIGDIAIEKMDEDGNNKQSSDIDENIIDNNGNLIDKLCDNFNSYTSNIIDKEFTNLSNDERIFILDLWCEVLESYIGEYGGIIFDEEVKNKTIDEINNILHFNPSTLHINTCKCVLCNEYNQIVKQKELITVNYKSWDGFDNYKKI